MHYFGFTGDKAFLYNGFEIIRDSLSLWMLGLKDFGGD